MNITDYKNIKEQMMDMIFNKKNVKYDQNLFEAFYDRMFPVREEFRKFLGTSGRDVMQNAAKRIANRLLFESAWNGTQFLFDNLLSFETKNLSESGDTYVPQDHVVHSVHLYLLGIYYYFHFSAFHDTLFGYFSETGIKSEYSYTRQEKAFWGFWESWRTFSLLHDVAYPFEAMFNKEGRIINASGISYLEKYCFMNEYMCYYASMEYFSGLVLLFTLMKKSEYELRSEMEEECGDFVEEKHGKCFKDYPEVATKEQMYRKLRGIYCNEDYKKYSQYFDKKEYVILIKNKYYDKIGLLLQRELESVLFVQKQLEQSIPECLKHIDKISRLELGRLGLHLEFYISDNINKVLGKGLSNINIRARMPEVEKISKRIEEELSVELSTVSEKKNLSDIQYNIMMYLIDKCSPERCIPARSFVKAMPESILKNRKDMLRQTILREMGTSLDAMMEDYRDTLSEEELTETLGKIREMNLKDFSSQVEVRYNEEKRQKDEDVLNVIEVLQKISHKFNEENEKTEANDRDLFADIYGEYKKQADPSIVERICQLLKKEKFLRAGDDIDVFLNYQTNYSCYDHGIVAGILTSVYYNRRKAVCERVRQKGIPVPGNCDFDTEVVTEQAIYAILVHNIYTDLYKEKCGRTPEHTLLLNPLSYYGMFCDNLQVWDRNKGINFGLVKWTGNTLYGEDISICFEDIQIRMLCRTHDIVESFRKLKESLEEYLTGSSKLISLNLLENGQ